MIRIITVVALATLYLQTFVFGFPDFSSGPGSCYPRDRCTVSRDEDEDHLWDYYTCECGPHCARHGTCCRDSEYAGTRPAHDSERPLGTCQSMAPYFREHVTLVSNCSDRWRHGHYARDMCERPDTSTPLIPVTSGDTGVTYRNHFSATCNFDGDDLREWVLRFTIRIGESFNRYNWTRDDLLQDLVHDRKSGTWRSPTHPDAFSIARWYFKMPTDLRKVVKKCDPLVVSDCDESYASDDELRYECLSYYSPVSVVSGGVLKKYRNVYCAICNDVYNLEDLIC